MPLRILPLPQNQEERTARILEARTRQLALRGAQPARGPVAPPLLLCAVGQEAYGLPLSEIAQVVPFAPCAPAPGQPAAMLGFHGRAGQVFIVLDLALALGLPASAPGGHLLLLRQAPRRFALRVDRALAAAEALPIVQAEAGHSAVSGHVMAPAGLAGPVPVLAGVIDPARLLLPFLPAPASSAPASSAPGLPEPGPSSPGA